MYETGDKIVYGASGVMQVVELRDMTVADVTRRYYVLREYGTTSGSETLVPVDNEQLIAQMRPLLTRDEIVEVIRDAKRRPDAEWISDNRARAEKFKQILSSGDRGELVAMIRAINLAGERRGEEGKKNFLADETAMKKAQKLLHSEVSIVLGIPMEDVPAFIDGL